MSGNVVRQARKDGGEAAIAGKKPSNHWKFRLKIFQGLEKGNSDGAYFAEVEALGMKVGDASGKECILIPKQQ